MEESLSELHFNKSLQTKVLRKLSVFLSAYPGYIVFGQTYTKFYSQGRYFKFSVFELYKLYTAIIQILTYLTEEKPIITKGLILERDKSAKIVYYWRGISLVIDNIEEKFFAFGIENKNDQNEEIKMNLLEVHNFIQCLKSTITICLCLNNIESEIFLAASNLEINRIIKLKAYKERKNFVSNFLAEETSYSQSDLQDSFKFTELLSYYFDIVILLNKLSSMSQFEEKICEQILSAK
jgi:hypothetical protein